LIHEKSEVEDLLIQKYIPKKLPGSSGSAAYPELSSFVDVLFDFLTGQYFGNDLAPMEKTAPPIPSSNPPIINYIIESAYSSLYSRQCVLTK
jgi:hypothetical protein